jgi:tetratricopeptide (TPR) repeat protein
MAPYSRRNTGSVSHGIGFDCRIRAPAGAGADDYVCPGYQRPSGPARHHGVELQRRAAICVSQRNFKVAEALQVQAVALLRSSPLKNDSELPDALNLLGVVYRHSGRLRKAESVLDEAVRLFEAGLHGGGRTRVLRAVHNLGTVLYLQRKYAKAERTFARAVSLWEKCCRDNPLSLARLLNNTAAMNSRMRRYDSAVACMSAVLPCLSRRSVPVTSCMQAH